MKWIEKIRKMDSDELAEFIGGGQVDKLRDEICAFCPCFKEDDEDDVLCTSEGADEDCTAALKRLLESEVEENAR